MDIRLDGKVALITGSGRNLGRAIAIQAAASGAKVATNTKSDGAQLDSLVGEIHAAGGQAIGILADVGDRLAVERMFDETELRLGPVDILVNCVGIRPKQPFHEISPEDWDTVLRTNLYSVFYTTRRALPKMVERKHGRIINLSGIDAIRAIGNRAHNITSKAGMLGFTRAIAFEYGEHGITANAVLPGLIKTARDEKDYPWWKTATGATPEQLKALTGTARLGSVEDVANLCVFLASDCSGYINGQTLHVNGGSVM